MTTPTDKALWIVWGRPVRPGTLALSVVTGSLGVNAVLHASILTGLWETIAGMIALVSAGALWVGWWAKSLQAMLAGLMLGALTWGSVTAVAITQPQVNAQTTIGAACWCLLAGGLWLRDRRETL